MTSATRWQALRPLLLVIAVCAAVPPILALTGVADKRDRTYEKRSNEGRRALNLQYEGDYQYEAAFEKCEIQSVDGMAATFGVPPDATAVARAYARRHAPAIRASIFRGCRDAFLGRWNPPGAAGPSVGAQPAQ